MLNKALKFQEYLKDTYNLSNEEATAFTGHAGFSGKSLNRAIVNSTMNSDQTTLANSIDAALSKLPKTIIHTLYRHIDFLIADQVSTVIDYFKDNIGKCINFNIFLSTTKLRLFTGDDNHFSIVMEIQTKQSSEGVDIHQLMTTAGLQNTEQEVLFPPHVIFKILGVTSEKPQIKLMEINSQSSAISFPRF